MNKNDDPTKPLPKDPCDVDQGVRAAQAVMERLRKMPYEAAQPGLHRAIDKSTEGGK